MLTGKCFVCVCAFVISHTGKDSFSPHSTKIDSNPKQLSKKQTKKKTRPLNVILDFNYYLGFFFLPFLSFHKRTSVVAAPPSNPFEKFSLAVMAGKDVTIDRLLLC